MTRSSAALCLALAAASCHTPNATPSPTVARAGEGGKVVVERTDDGGRTFAPSEPPVEATDVLLADHDACALLGDVGGPVATRDRGATWTSLAPLPAGLSSPRLARTPQGWLAVGGTGDQSSALLALRDGAAAWEELAPAWTER